MIKMKRPFDKEKDITTSLNKYVCPQRGLQYCNVYIFFHASYLLNPLR